MNRIENVYEVTQRLCGMINPVGDAAVDAIRLQNLRQTIDVANRLLFDIEMVAIIESNGEKSIDKAKGLANEFIKDLHEAMIKP